MVIARIMYTVMKALIWLALYFPVARSVKTWRAVSLDRDRCSINSLRICFIINNCLYSPHPARQLAGTPHLKGEGPQWRNFNLTLIQALYSILPFTPERGRG